MSSESDAENVEVDNAEESLIAPPPYSSLSPTVPDATISSSSDSESSSSSSSESSSSVPAESSLENEIIPSSSSSASSSSSSTTTATTTSTSNDNTSLPTDLSLENEIIPTSDKDPLTVDRRRNSNRVRESLEIELADYLQKKNTKGFYQHRYFKTCRHILHYWTDKSSCETGGIPESKSFDMTEIKSIEKNSHKRIFTLFFMNDKFKLDLKAPSEESYLEWTELIFAKRALYSVSELLSALNKEKGLKFQTATFGTLLLMKEKEKVDWIVNKLSEVFDNESSKTSNSDISSLQGSLICVEDMISICKECEVELAQHNPKVSAHCKNFIFRYADVLKGTIVLELSQLVNFKNGKRTLNDMSEKVLCLAISFMDRVYQLKMFKFVPPDFVSSLESMLFSCGELQAVVMDHCIENINIWFSNIVSIPEPNKRYDKIAGIFEEISNNLCNVKLEPKCHDLQVQMIRSVLMNQILNFSDLIGTISFEGYELSSLASHILTCDRLIMQITNARVRISDGRIIVNGGGSNSSSKNNSHSSSSNNHTIGGGSGGGFGEVAVDNALVDSLKTACAASSELAAAHAVTRLRTVSSDIMPAFFVEKSKEWIGGAVCITYIDKIDKWVQAFCENIPSAYLQCVVYKQTKVMILSLYLEYMFKFMKGKSDLTARGVQQVVVDLNMIKKWMEKIASLTLLANDDGSSDGNNNNNNDGINGSNASYVECDEYVVVNLCIKLLSNSESSLMQAYIHTIVYFGFYYRWYLFDITRTMLKLRNMNSDSRYEVLGTCAEFISQLETANSMEVDLLNGSRESKYRRSKSRCFLDEMLPNVGVLFATGSKWKLALLSDPSVVRVAVARMITETCNLSRAEKKKAADARALLQSQLSLKSSQSDKSQALTSQSSFESNLTTPSSSIRSSESLKSQNNDNAYADENEITIVDRSVDELPFHSVSLSRDGNVISMTIGNGDASLESSSRKSDDSNINTPAGDGSSNDHHVSSSTSDNAESAGDNDNFTGTVNSEDVHTAAGGSLSTNDPSTEDSLPDGWRAVVDGSTGRTFYVNKTNKMQRQWQRPTHAVAGRHPKKAAEQSSKIVVESSDINSSSSSSSSNNSNSNSTSPAAVSKQYSSAIASPNATSTTPSSLTEKDRELVRAKYSVDIRTLSYFFQSTCGLGVTDSQEFAETLVLNYKVTSLAVLSRKKATNKLEEIFNSMGIDEDSREIINDMLDIEANKLKSRALSTTNTTSSISSSDSATASSEGRSTSDDTNDPNNEEYEKFKRLLQTAKQNLAKGS